LGHHSDHRLRMFCRSIVYIGWPLLHGNNVHDGDKNFSINLLLKMSLSALLSIGLIAPINDPALFLLFPRYIVTPNGSTRIRFLFEGSQGFHKLESIIISNGGWSIFSFNLCPFPPIVVVSGRFKGSRTKQYRLYSPRSIPPVFRSIHTLSVGC